MADVEVFTAARMQTIEDTTVTSGLVDVHGNLLLTRRDGTQINAGLVKGDPGSDAEAHFASTPDVIVAGNGTVGTPYNFSVKNLSPIGHIVQKGAATAPSGSYLPCKGQAISRSTYSALFAEIGTLYGAGDGSTTFNLPNLNGKTAIFETATVNGFFIDDAFAPTPSSPYFSLDSYKVDVHFRDDSAGYFDWCFRAGGVDDRTNHYNFSGYYQNTGTFGNTPLTSNENRVYGIHQPHMISYMELDLRDVGKADWTYFNATVHGMVSASPWLTNRHGFHATSTRYDGLRFWNGDGHAVRGSISVTPKGGSLIPSYIRVL